MGQIDTELTVEKLNSERITKVEEKFDRGLSSMNEKMDRVAQAVASLAGKDMASRKENFIPWVITMISIVLGIGGMLQQQNHFQDTATVRAISTLDHKIEEGGGEILRIREWKDAMESTLPANIASNTVYFERLNKSVDTLEGRMTYLTKKFFEFKTCTENKLSVEKRL